MIRDLHDCLLPTFCDRNLRPTCKFHRIVDEIAEGALELVCVPMNDKFAGAVEAHIRADVDKLINDGM